MIWKKSDMNREESRRPFSQPGSCYGGAQLPFQSDRWSLVSPWNGERQVGRQWMKWHHVGDDRIKLVSWVITHLTAGRRRKVGQKRPHAGSLPVCESVVLPQGPLLVTVSACRMFGLTDNIGDCKCPSKHWGITSQEIWVENKNTFIIYYF